MRFDFEFTGLTPILFHADDIVEGDALKGWRDDPKNAAQSVRGDDRSPAWTWQSYLYKDEAHLAVPSDNVLAAIRWAGAKMILKGKTTFKSATQSGLMISTEFCKFEGPVGQVSLLDLESIRGLDFSDQVQAVKPLGFQLFAKRAKIGAAKHVRVRARFNTWKLSGQIEIINPDIKADTLKRILEIAGDQSGLLDWRPSSKQSPGPFGRFSVTLRAAK